MPLLDHFRGALSKGRPWDSVFAVWASSIIRALNPYLPREYTALPHLRFATRTTAEVEEPRDGDSGAPSAVWAPEPPTLEAPADWLATDTLEVQVFNREGWRRLAAVVKFVTPPDKDHDSRRRAFASRCASYLQQSIGLVVVDVVTTYPANLHHELLRLLGKSEPLNTPALAGLYVVAYRTRVGADQTRLEAWEELLALGSPLPVLPVWISPEIAVPLDLERSYRDMCEGLRIPQ
ncbi:MAG: hypothetical protein L0Z62_35345 [Gemmataceae bacterium]|nr:hypothetical protein [Gemmataceae bacterium]